MNEIFLDCHHENTITISGKVVCTECGLEIGEALSDTSFIQGRSNEKFSAKYSRQYIGPPKKERIINVIGSEMHIGVSGDKINDIRKFRRLKRRNGHFQTKEVQRQYRILKILNKIGNHLNIPKYILDDSAIRFRKIENSGIHIVNRISCICFCLWDSIRLYKYFICLKELFNTFIKMGHRVNKKSMIRDGCIYREILFRNGMKKTSPKSIKDYINRHIGTLRSNPDEIEMRLRFKRFSITPEMYISKLETLSYSILERMHDILRFRGINPYDTSMSCIYFAGLVLSRSNGEKTILTQEFLREISGIPAYSIREIFVKTFKPSFPLFGINIKTSIKEIF